MDIGAIVLAAGAGVRIGQRPKALLEYQGMPLLHHTIAALHCAGVDRIVVVLGHHDHWLQPVLKGLPCTSVRNPQPQEDNSTSQRVGLQALALEQCEAVVMTLADQPLLRMQHIKALLQAWMQREKQIHMLYPWHSLHHTRGNPVVISSAVGQKVLASAHENSGDWNCRLWQQRHPHQAWAWHNTQPAYFVDIDTPEDIEKLHLHHDMMLSWPPNLR